MVKHIDGNCTYRDNVLGSCKNYNGGKYMGLLVAMMHPGRLYVSVVSAPQFEETDHILTPLYLAVRQPFPLALRFLNNCAAHCSI